MPPGTFNGKQRRIMVLEARVHVGTARLRTPSKCFRSAAELAANNAFLDEGPIIAQAVAPVDHAFDAEAMVEQGRDVESQVLARALRKLIERRVFLNGHRTVVF